MSARSRRTRPTTLVVLVVVVLVVVVAAVLVAVWLWPNDRSRPVPADEAVSNYRASSVPVSTAPSTPIPSSADTDATPEASTVTASTTAVPSTVEPSIAPPPSSSTPATTPTLELPEPGVYRYSSTGWEEVDALNGARHEYPDETTITVTSEGCGVRLRWDALRERYDEWQLCTTGLGVELQPDAIQYHEFFQQPELEHLVCDRSVVVVPAGEPPDRDTTQSCLLGDDPWVATWSVIERSTRAVAGADVPVWHVRMTVDDDDEHWEHTIIDWYFDDRGLPVAIASTKESNSPSPIGDVVYREDYELSAVSLTPLR